MMDKTLNNLEIMISSNMYMEVSETYLRFAILKFVCTSSIHLLAFDGRSNCGRFILNFLVFLVFDDCLMEVVCV